MEVEKYGGAECNT